MALIGRLFVILFAFLAACLVAGMIVLGAVLFPEFTDLGIGDIDPAINVVIGLGFIFISGFALIPAMIVAAITEALYIRSVLAYAVGGALVGAACYLGLIPFDPDTMLVGLGCGRIAHIAGVRPAMAGGMLVLAVSFLLLAAIGPASGFGLVLAGLIVSGIGQGLAFNLSTTAAMSSIAEEKAGAASGILTAIRIVGVAVGVAATGVLVRSLENDKATALVAAARGSLSPEAKADLGRLLSGAPEAAAALAKLTPVAADHVKEIVRASFDAGFTAGMLLCLAVSILATAVAVLIKEPPRVAHA